MKLRTASTRQPKNRILQLTLQELTTYLHELIENSPVAILVLDPDHRVQMCNPAFEALFQYSRQELTRAHLEELIAAGPLTPEAVEIWKRVLAGEKVYAATKRRRKDGSVVDVEIHGIPLKVKGKLIGVYGIYHDVSERREAELALRQLSARLLQLQDEERRRIARELHDTTAQKLVALTMNLTRFRELCMDCNPDALHLIEESQALAEQSAKELRTLSYLLHPPTLDDMGLSSAISWYARGFSHRSGVEVSLELPPLMTRLPRDIETTMFRVVQEGLTNVHRHSGSPIASIRLTSDAEQIVLEISDRGVGIPSNLQGATVALGVGIAGMRERVHQLGGTLDIISDQHGTTLRVHQPVPLGDTDAA